MLEAAETGRSLAKEDYEARVPGLRTALVNAQYDLREAKRALLVVIAGDDRPGAVEVFNRLHEWMDARHILSHAWGPPEHGEESYPPYWRYWQALPPRGAFGLWLGGEAQACLHRRLEDELDDGAFARALERQRRFEEMLAAEGVTIRKLWIHLSGREHAKRLKKAEKGGKKGKGKDKGKKGKGSYRLDETDWRIGDDWERVAPEAEAILSRTDSEVAPWRVVEAGDERHLCVTAAEAVLEALGEAIAGVARASAEATHESATPTPGDPLAALDLSLRLPYEEYRERLDALQRELFGLAERAEEEGVRPVLVFQGWDAAGKGGVIRRITRALDARDYRVVSIGPPSDEERRRPWLWRFWRHLTPAGRAVIFDRSWYGRVLVERVEGFASEAEWRRAYDEIGELEAQLVEADSLVLKFFLHIDPEEQLRRFRAREQTVYKKYKISRDDYRNRERWGAYVEAVAEMVARTHREDAPWHLVAANDKRWARVAVIEAVCAALRRDVG